MIRLTDATSAVQRFVLRYRPQASSSSASASNFFFTPSPLFSFPPLVLQIQSTFGHLSLWPSRSQRVLRSLVSALCFCATCMPSVSLRPIEQSLLDCFLRFLFDNLRPCYMLGFLTPRIASKQRIGPFDLLHNWLQAPYLRFTELDFQFAKYFPRGLSGCDDLARPQVHSLRNVCESEFRLKYELSVALAPLLGSELAD